MLIESIRHRVAHASASQFLLILIGIQVLLHLPVISLPPVGQHVWRQVMGLAPARNYYEEDHAFLSPAQDVRVGLEDTGETYIEFPLLYWIIGKSYTLTGFSHANGRLVMLAMACLLIVFSYAFIKAWGVSESRARWYVFLLSSSPYFFYYAVTVSPDMPALTWFVGGLALLIPAVRSERWDWKFWLGGSLILLGTLSKATYLFFGLPLAYLFLRQYRKTRHFQVLGVAILLGGLVLLVNAWMFHYSGEQVSRSPFERTRWIEREPSPLPNSWEEVRQIVYAGSTKWFLEMYVNTAAIPLFVVGLYSAIRRRVWRSAENGFWTAWLMSFALFAACFIIRFYNHEYYLTPLLLITPLITAVGVQVLWQHPLGKKIALVCLVLVPFVMVLRVNGRWIKSLQVPNELLYQSAAFEQIIPSADRILVLDHNSPLTYLYYLHRKGLRITPQYVAPEDLERYYQLHFRWIVSPFPLDTYPVFQPWIKFQAKVGTFTIYQFGPVPHASL